MMAKKYTGEIEPIKDDKGNVTGFNVTYEDQTMITVEQFAQAGGAADKISALLNQNVKTATATASTVQAKPAAAVSSKTDTSAKADTAAKAQATTKPAVPAAPKLVVAPRNSAIVYILKSVPNAASYKLVYKTAAGSEKETIVNIPENVTTGTIPNLKNGVKYAIRAFAVNVAGTSAASTIEYATPKA